MKNLFYVSSLLAIAACGISEEDYKVDYAARYCEQYVTCESEFECADGTGTSSETEDLFADCEFDAAQAQACLDGEWTCDELSLPVPPADCNSVYSCPTTGGTTAE